MQATLFSSALLGATSVMMGALGAHTVSAPEQSWNSAVYFGLFHALAAMICAILSQKINMVRFAGAGFIIGATCFSGAIWLKYLLPVGAPLSLIGKAAPIGGILLLCSWLLLAFSSLRAKQL